MVLDNRNINVSNKRILKSLAYYTNDTNFGSFSFFHYLTEDGHIDKSKFATESWREKIIQEDLNTLNALKQNSHVFEQINNFYSVNGYQKQYEKLSKKTMELFGIDRIPKLYIVDTLPPPVDKTDWCAVAPDAEDEKYFNVPQGIYFKRNSLTHGYFEFIIAHELVHWAISEYNKIYFRYVPLIEEGLADILAIALILSSKCLAGCVESNLFIYNRLSSPPNTFSNYYWVSCRQIIALLINEGIEKLINLVKNGRVSLSKVDIPKLVTTKHYNDIFTNKILDIVFSTNSYFTLNIDNYIILRESIENKTIENTIDITKICKRLEIPEIVAEKSLSELVNCALIVKEEDGFYQANNIMFPNSKYII